MARGFGSTDSVTDSRTGTDGPLWEGRVHAGGRLSMARGFGSTDSVADASRGRERMSALVGGESTREGCQRTLSRTRGRGRMSALGGGESTREAIQT